MKNYPLTRLLRVREHRVDAAKAHVAKCRAMLEQAKERATEALRVAKKFAAARPQKEKDLFEAIRNKVLERKELDRFHDRIAALAAQELELFDIAEQEKLHVRAAEETLEKAVAAHSAATREVRKFEEHRALWWQEEQKRLSAIEEQETEEIAGIIALRRKGE